LDALCLTAAFTLDTRKLPTSASAQTYFNVLEAAGMICRTHSDIV
jgi:hypothetical protein